MIYNECDIIQIDEDCEVVSPNKNEESTSRPKNMRDYHQAYGRKHPKPSAIAKSTKIPKSNKIPRSNIIAKPWRMEAEPFLLDASSNSILYNLIAFVVSNHKGPNLDLIDRLRQEMVTKLIKLFSNNHLQTIHHKITNKRVFEKLNKTIEESFLKYILRQWKGWKLYDFKNDTNEIICNNLSIYLKSCFKDFFGLKEKCLRDELKEYEKNNEDAMLVFSSLCDLKTLFYHEPHKFSNYYRDLGVLKNNLASGHIWPTAVQLLNWPYVSTQVVFPRFKMIHQNMNTNKFKLIDLKKGYEPFTGEPQNMNLHYQPSSNTKTLPSSLIASFIGQLKNVINAKYPFQNMKIELIDILTEFEKDIALCSDNIETNTYYYQNFSAYPYVRYLGMPTQGNAPVISPFDQTVIKDSQVNVRLQQLAFPGLSFNLELFEMSRLEDDESGKDRFVFKGDFFRMIKDNIIYTCTLCNTNFKFSSALIFHLSELHGVEPDWKCAMCNVYFCTKYLSSKRWQHQCQFVDMQNRNTSTRMSPCHTNMGNILLRPV